MGAGAERCHFERLGKEISQLWRGAQESCKGASQSFLVFGQPGSGKTHLLKELAARARMAQIRVLTFSARYENSRGEPVARKIICDLDGCLFPDGVDSELAAEAISRSRAPVASRSLPSNFGNKGNLIDSLKLVDSLCAALGRAAASTPVLLILDDFDEADHASAEAVTAAARHAGPMKLMIVASCVSVDRAEEAARPSLAEFSRLAVHIRLAGAPSRCRAISSSAPADDGDPLKERSLSAQQIAPARSPLGSTMTTHGTDGSNHAQRQVHTAFMDSAYSSQIAEVHERCELLIALGEAQSRQGENEAAENSLREAAALAERLQDPGRLTRIVLALPAWHWPGPGEANPLALLLAQRGLAIEREDGGRRAIFMARLAAELSYAPEHQRYSADLAAAALEQVLTKLDPLSELYVRLYRDQVLRRPDQLSERIANAEETLRLAIEAGDYGACCVAALGKSSALTAMGDMAAAEHEAEFAVGIVPTSQVRFHHGLSAAYRAHRAVSDGRFADAAQEFGRCRALVDAYKLPYLVDACWPTMLLPYGEEERLSELEVLAEDTVSRRPSALVYAALLSWLKVQVGCFTDASFLLDRLAADEFAGLSRSAEGVVGIAALAAVCTALDRTDCAAILHDRLLPCAGLNVTLNAVAAFGSAERYVGIFASVLGRLDEAIGHFEKSFRFDRGSGARPWAVYSGCELASSLARRGTAEDRTRALGLLPPLEAEAAGLKMKRASARLGETRELLSGGKITPTKSRDTTASLVVEAGALSDGSQRDPANGERVAIFCRKGEYWQIGFGQRTSSLRHRRGLELISFLVRHPGRDIFALELTHEGEAQPPVRGRKDEGGGDSAHAPVLDAEAKRSYRERLSEIRRELEELHGAHDFERASKLEKEQDFLTRELARAIGLFGRDRKLGSEPERARKRVSIAITRAIRLISLQDEQFGSYLERSIKTGNLCTYTPDPANPVKWQL